MQSKIGKELNRIMAETGESPMKVMAAYMKNKALNVGNHTFVPKPAKPIEE